MPSGGKKGRRRREQEQRRKQQEKRKRRIEGLDLNDIPVEDTRSQKELERLVEQACRFIADAKKRHARRLGLVVGEYLYLNLYKADDAYLTSNYRGKTRSLRDIAARTGFTRETLRYWIVAAATRLKLGKLGFDSDRLTLSHFAALYRLRDNLELTRQFAEWVERENVSCEDLRARVVQWRRFIEEGGRFEDILVEPEARKKRRKGRSRPPDELRIVRILMLVHRWVRATRLGAGQREAIRSMLEEIRRGLRAMEARR